jgi:penicillin-binding protein 2
MPSIRNRQKDIDPDEIFMDSSNIPSLNKDQMEGRLNQPISKRSITILFVVFVFVLTALGWKSWQLQIRDGYVYAELGENNRLNYTLIFSERGVITDRNKVQLVWNEFFEEESAEDSIPFASRTYADISGVSHILGYISYPKVDSSGFYYRESIEGKSGVELSYNEELRGVNGTRIVETDVQGTVLSEAVVEPPIDGKDLSLTIDSRIQEKLYSTMRDLSQEVGFSGGASVIMDVTNGEVIALVSYPEFKSQVITNGTDAEAIASYVQSEETPFLNRAIAGLYAPGSTIKPYVALGALEEKVIDPLTEIFSSGVLKVQNPYNPDEVSLHHDWKAHGWVNMRDALAVSSNIYFFEVGGGFEDQKGIGISGIEKFTKLFGFNTATGIDIGGEAVGLIPSPEWKKKVFDGDDWRLGDTYNTAIGQYGFQVTPLEMVRAVASIASDGLIVEPHVVARGDAGAIGTIDISEESFRVVKEGMRQAVTAGSSTGVNIPGVKIAAKSGTAEVGISKKRVNSWLVGFFPYDSPRYAFVTVMEKGPRDNLVGATFVMRQAFEWMTDNTPEYFK